MMNWLRDRDNKVTFINKRISLDSLRWKRSENSLSDSSDSTLIHLDRETLKMISKSYRKLLTFRTFHEQVIITNSIAYYTPCLFFEREYLQIYQSPSTPRKRSFRDLTPKPKEKRPSVVKRALLQTNLALEQAKLYISQINWNPDMLDKKKKRRQSEVFDRDTSLTETLNLRRRKSDIF
eukprot:NODE_1211_length_1782_cov_0.489602.p2 type:complete len:179 gc:universal NODE_1211_length_1782_cov_0.489602:358-894(+)